MADTGSALAPGLFSVGPIYGGSSTDMSRIFVQSSEQALAEAPAFANEVYEWHDGAFNLVSRLPNGEVASEGLVPTPAPAAPSPATAPRWCWGWDRPRSSTCVRTGSRS